MAVQDVAYVELYTSNKKSTVDYFVSSMGFRHVAEAVAVDRSSALLRQGRAQLVVTTGPATWRFLATHGDGIADIALTCDDVDQSVRSTVAAGATSTTSVSGSPTVDGFGGVVHTLLPHPEGSAAGLPPGHNWIDVTDAPAGRPHAGWIQLLDHITVCVEGGSLGTYEAFYRDALGLSRYSSEHVDGGEHAMDSTVMRSDSDRVTFTFVAPDPRKGPGQLGAFLERNGGPGVHSLAFLVQSIVPAAHGFRDRGMKFLTVEDAYYDSLEERVPGMRAEIDALRSAQVLADRDEWGDLLRLFSRSPYERNTLFYELVERRGSRGFGSAHVRALYDAVERDRLAAE